MRRVVAATADGHEHPHPHLGRLIGIDDIDPQVVLLRDRPCLVGEDRGADVVRGTVGQRPGDVRSLGDHDAALGGSGQGRGIGAGGDEDQLVEDRRYRVDLVAIDRPRIVGALDDAPGDQAGRHGCVPVESIGERRDPDREALDRSTAQPALGRGRDPPDGLAIEGGRVTETDRQDASARGFAARGQRRRVALARELPERDERLELTAGTPIDLAERALEGRFGGDGHDEDIRGHVPRLIGDDTKLHGVGLRKAQPRDAGWALGDRWVGPTV